MKMILMVIGNVWCVIPVSIPILNQYSALYMNFIVDTTATAGTCTTPHVVYSCICCRHNLSSSAEILSDSFNQWRRHRVKSSCFERRLHYLPYKCSYWLQCPCIKRQWNRVKNISESACSILWWRSSISLFFSFVLKYFCQNPS